MHTMHRLEALKDEKKRSSSVEIKLERPLVIELGLKMVSEIIVEPS